MCVCMCACVCVRTRVCVVLWNLEPSGFTILIPWCDNMLGWHACIHTYIHTYIGICLPGIVYYPYTAMASKFKTREAHPFNDFELGGGGEGGSISKQLA